MYLASCHQCSERFVNLYAFGTRKPQLIVMTIACLHNFLRRGPDSAAIYTPPRTSDYEENGRVIEGSWRATSNENMTSLFPIRKTARKSTLNAK